MSRIGNKPVALPAGVTAEVKDGAITVKGAKGTLSVTLNKGISCEVKDNALVFTRANNLKQTKQNHGTVRANVANAVTGVSKGFTKTLTMIGIGYKAAMKGKDVEIWAGYSHTVVVTPNEGVSIAVNDGTTIVCSGIDKQAVGQTAARIREIRSPEPYLGKGIRYENEFVATKEGKRAGAGAKK